MYCCPNFFFIISFARPASLYCQDCVCVCVCVCMYICICVYIYIYIYYRKKILSSPSFGGEVKPSVPCRRFAACKRSLNLRGSRNLGKITGHLCRPQFHLSLLGSLASLRTYRHLAAKVGTSKCGGKAMAIYPQELAQDAVCQGHTGHMTVLWFLPTRPLRLNTNE